MRAWQMAVAVVALAGLAGCNKAEEVVLTQPEPGALSAAVRSIPVETPADLDAVYCAAAQSAQRQSQLTVNDATTSAGLAATIEAPVIDCAARQFLVAIRLPVTAAAAGDAWRAQIAAEASTVNCVEALSSLAAGAGWQLGQRVTFSDGTTEDFVADCSAVDIVPTDDPATRSFAAMAAADFDPAFCRLMGVTRDRVTAALQQYTADKVDPVITPGVRLTGFRVDCTARSAFTELRFEGAPSAFAGEAFAQELVNARACAELPSHRAAIEGWRLGDAYTFSDGTRRELAAVCPPLPSPAVAP